MITLHGSPISNYHNKVKLALLEKGVDFTEASVGTPGAFASDRSASPLGKIPYLVTEEGTLCESAVLLDYIEARWPQPPLLPADPFGAAKVRELVTFIDWHLEMAARQLYPSAFFGQPALSEANALRIRKQLEAAIAAFKSLARFSPYVAGDTFTQADCAAFASLPLVAMASKATYGEDLLAAAGIDHKAYVRFIGERPAAQRVLADRKAASLPKA